jgi:hypothetical protein
MCVLTCIYDKQRTPLDLYPYISAAGVAGPVWPPVPRGEMILTAKSKEYKVLCIDDI